MIFPSLKAPRAGILFFVLLFLWSGLTALCGQEPSTDIWTEDEPPPLEEPWSGRRLESFLSRLEQEDPNRAAELRQLRQTNPEKFQEMVRLEMQRRFRPGEQPQPPEPTEGPQGPKELGPGPEGATSMGPGGGRWLEHLQRRHEEFIQWLEKNNPELAAELEQIREKDPGLYFSRVMEARRRYEPILRAEKDNPELAEVLKEDLILQKQRDELLKKLRGTEGAERERLLKELKTIISQRFDLIVRKKTLQYQELEERIKRLQKEIERRQAEVNKLKQSKEQAVEEHLKELTAQAEKINWD
ncbi:MAG TPA: hypothetical protein PLX18_03530 [Anaerohalosphaeraceae bacterium]|jgi:hypothetical protein|nr:hypothetical protein [Phycisphaerae bacterium]HOT71998.1 hypothetical protein [Anaerohalosphaeraceae bacterium]HQG05200.1 hypothetical protein [Anaerohalosphaeraceae bacterium]HQI06918.1 hypothetical protein [Anaerohalosphaeraceae bacterium]HQJ66614.1 hypothetical protein [Anaerohalosphaeraceae bacterium]